MNQKGITLISIIITVVVLIIIAFIATNAGEGSGEMAMMTTFMSDMDNVKVELAIIRANNADEFNDSEHGFTRVTMVGAPEEFVSFSDNSSQVIGYLIDVNQLSAIPFYGVGTISGSQVTFDEDDVLVYDKNGTVFYAKGYEQDNEIYYNATVYKVK